MLDKYNRAKKFIIKIIIHLKQLKEIYIYIFIVNFGLNKLLSKILAQELFISHLVANRYTVLSRAHNENE